MKGKTEECVERNMEGNTEGNMGRCAEDSTDGSSLPLVSPSNH